MGSRYNEIQVEDSLVEKVIWWEVPEEKVEGSKLVGWLEDTQEPTCTNKKKLNR